jgi:hypothetical protein
MAGSKTETVNLDALIPREDVASKKPGSGKGGVLMPMLDYEANFYGLLRKPLFQRETDDWSVDNVVSLIRSFRDGHLIPAVILWAAQGYTFVIDGAHRLSVFIAWVNDDYGDRTRSESYFGHDIPERQKVIAQKCRDAIRASGLEYKELNSLTKLRERTELQLQWSSAISQPIEAQWVPGDAAVALQSFLDINQRAVSIDRTERYMIEELEAPAVIATRAIVNSARGHQYWGAFAPPLIIRIETAARRIYDAIFEPENAQPHKDAQLQPAGAAYTASGLRLTLDLVNLVNDFSGRAKGLPKDLDGQDTANVAEKTWAVVKYIGGGGSSSLDLFPSVYFWGDTGNHRPTAFLAVASLMQDMVRKEELRKFTLHRAKFEEYLIEQNGFVGRVLKKHGGWKKSLTPTKTMLKTLLECLYRGDSNDEIETQLTALLTKRKDGSDDDAAASFSRTDAWRETRAALRIKASLDSAHRCGICKARMLIPNASDDHLERRADGGHSGIRNGQLTHPFCNTGFKNYYDQRGEPLPEISAPA